MGFCSVFAERLRQGFYLEAEKRLIKILHSDRSACIFVDVPETEIDLRKPVTRGALDLVLVHSEATETWLGNNLHLGHQNDREYLFHQLPFFAQFHDAWMPALFRSYPDGLRGPCKGPSHPFEAHMPNEPPYHLPPPAKHPPPY